MKSGFRRLLGRKGQRGRAESPAMPPAGRPDESAVDRDSPSWSESDGPGVDLAARSPESGLRFGDIAVLGGLMNAGADLSRSRPVVWYLRVRSAAGAEATMQAVAGAGYRAVLIAPEPKTTEPAAEAEAEHATPGETVNQSWIVTCELADAIVDIRFVLDNDAILSGLAAEHGGVLDGWEAGLRTDELDGNAR